MMAEWGVDYYKMDGCYADIKQFDDGGWVGRWVGRRVGG